MIGTIVRALGKCPTNHELEEMLTDVPNNVDLDTVTKIYKKKMPKVTDLESGMRAAFSALDKEGNGTIMAAELRHILTTLGEPLDHKEVDQLLKRVEQDGAGNVFYGSYIDQIVS